MNTFQPGIYQHYKGTHYYAYGTARHTETDELMVIYATADSHGELWVRPLTMFSETIKTKQGTQQRFELVSDQISNGVVE